MTLIVIGEIGFILLCIMAGLWFAWEASPNQNRPPVAPAEPSVEARPAKKHRAMGG